MPTKTDANHAKIRDSLRDCGYVVEDLAHAGRGIPDLMVGAHGVIFLLEVKSDAGKLRQSQIDFFTRWMAYPVYMVRSLEEALEVINDRL